MLRFHRTTKRTTFVSVSQFLFNNFQGLVAGMDDGIGFAIGSLIGGQMYQRLGGTLSFRIFSIAALIICIAHYYLRPATKFDKHEAKGGYSVPSEEIKFDTSHS